MTRIYSNFNLGQSNLLLMEKYVKNINAAPQMANLYSNLTNVNFKFNSFVDS